MVCSRPSRQGQGSCPHLLRGWPVSILTHPAMGSPNPGPVRGPEHFRLRETPKLMMLLIPEKWGFWRGAAFRSESLFFCKYHFPQGWEWSEVHCKSGPQRQDEGWTLAGAHSGPIGRVFSPKCFSSSPFSPDLLTLGVPAEPSVPWGPMQEGEGAEERLSSGFPSGGPDLFLF